MCPDWWDEHLTELQSVKEAHEEEVRALIQSHEAKIKELTDTHAATLEELVTQQQELQLNTQEATTKGSLEVRVCGNSSTHFLFADNSMSESCADTAISPPCS